MLDDLIAEGRKLFDLAVMPYEPVEVYDQGVEHGMWPVWAIANDALEDEEAEEPVLNLVVETGDRGEADWIAWLINNGEALLDALEASKERLADIRRYQDEAFVAIAQKQKRDRDRIAELEARLEIAKTLVSSGLMLRIDGEDMHLPTPTWRAWDSSAESFLRAGEGEPQPPTFAGESDV